MTSPEHIPALPGVAARRITRPRSELLLPLAVAEREARPLDLLLSSLSHVGPGEAASTVVVLRGIGEREKRRIVEREIAAVYGDNAGIAAPDLLAPTAQVFRLFARWLFVGGGKKKQRRVQERRDRLADIRSSKEGKARLDRAEHKLYAASLYTVGAAQHGGEDRLADELAGQLTAALSPGRAVAAGHSGFSIKQCDSRAAISARQAGTRAALLVTADEAAAIAHPPDANTNASGLTLASTAVPLLDAPAWMETSWRPGLLRLGEVMPGTDRARVVCMNIDDLSGSAYLTGRSGSGKSVWLESILRDLAAAPQGATFAIDPNATLVRHALMLLARDHPELLRSGKVAAVDWSDPASSVAWNPLAARDAAEVEIACFVTETLIAALNTGGFDQLVRALGYLRAGIRCLADANLALYRAAVARGDDPSTVELLTVLDLRRFFTDDDFRDRLLAFANQDVATRFRELEELKPAERRVIFDALLHRLDTCANTPSVALLADCPRNKLWWEDQLDQGATVLHGLDVLGAAGAASSGVLPTLLAQYFRCAEDMWVRRGRPTGDALREIVSVMVADEIQNLAAVASGELQRALAMLRKTGVRLIGASQYQRQMTDAGGNELGEAIRLNVAHRFSFLVPSTEGKGLDAAALDRQRGIIDGEVLANLPRFHLIASPDLTRPDGRTEQPDPFVLHSIDPKHPTPGDPDYETIMSAVEAVYARGRELYCRPRAVAERERNEHPQRIVAELQRAATEQLAPAADAGGGIVLG